MFIPSTFKRPVSSWKALNLRKTLLMASSVRLKPLNCSRLPCVYAHAVDTQTVCGTMVGAGVGHDNNISVPPLTMAGKAFAVLLAIAVRIFEVIDAEMWTMDHDVLEQGISPRIHADIPVALDRL